jgi:phosphoribosylformylglycinamidine synthase
MISSAHDCSDGGLFIAILESCLAGNVGCEISLPQDIRKDFYLFGESQGRVIISFDSSSEQNIAELAAALDVPFIVLGETRGEEILISGERFGSLEEYRALYHSGVSKFMTAQNDQL